jgi:hypothetical protein
MGKNKNKGFDLAKRQEKILKRMAKPLYKKPDSSLYFVITQPFGMHPSPAERETVDVNRLASWICWVFRRESVVEAVYTVSTVSRGHFAQTHISHSSRRGFFPSVPSEGRNYYQNCRMARPEKAPRGAQVQEDSQRGLAV